VCGVGVLSMGLCEYLQVKILRIPEKKKEANNHGYELLPHPQ
jgi:hypothetical protein